MESNRASTIPQLDDGFTEVQITYGDRHYLLKINTKLDRYVDKTGLDAAIAGGFYKALVGFHTSMQQHAAHTVGMKLQLIDLLRKHGDDGYIHANELARIVYGLPYGKGVDV